MWAIASVKQPDREWEIFFEQAAAGKNVVVSEFSLLHPTHEALAFRTPVQIADTSKRPKQLLHGNPSSECWG